MTLEEAQMKIAELNGILCVKRNEIKQLEKENNSLSNELDEYKFNFKQNIRNDKLIKKIIKLLYNEFPHLFGEVMRE